MCFPVVEHTLGSRGIRLLGGDLHPACAVGGRHPSRGGDGLRQSKSALAAVRRFPAGAADRSICFTITFICDALEQYFSSRAKIS